MVRFLEVLAESCQVTVAAQAAGIPRRTLYDCRRADPEFALAWERAIETGAEVLLAEAHRRAVEGCPEPVVSAGKVVMGPNERPLVVRRYSDRLLELLLRAYRPDLFKERAISATAEAATPDGGVLRVRFKIDGHVDGPGRGDGE